GLSLWRPPSAKALACSFADLCNPNGLPRDAEAGLDDALRREWRRIAHGRLRAPRRFDPHGDPSAHVRVNDANDESTRRKVRAATPTKAAMTPQAKALS